MDLIFEDVSVDKQIRGRHNNLRGFKFLNSWGTDSHDNGFGYISVDQLAGSLGTAVLLREIEVAVD